MDLLVIDFETYYAKDYTLSKMQTDEYVLDPRFEVMLVAVKRNDEDTQWFSGDMEATRDWLGRFNWANSLAVAHNALFDAFILTQRFGYRPKRWLDTLGMARAVYPHLASHSLAYIAKTLGLPAKGDYVVLAFGKTRESLNAAELESYAEYCVNDVELTYSIFLKLVAYLPSMEANLIDMTIKMFTEPKLIADMALLDEIVRDEVTNKENLLAAITADKESLMSNQKFSELLYSLGVEPPTKISERTGKRTFAFAKSDAAFTALLEHDDPRVQAVVAARLGVKSTITETRTKRIKDTALRNAKTVYELDDPSQRIAGALPIYLNYWGAKTTGRFSGGNKINWQNLPARGPSAKLRKALRAPDGYKIVVADSSNIELRVAMVAAGQDNAVQALWEERDLYCEFATKLFGRTITKQDDKERQLGKLAMLSLQYGAGAAKFGNIVRLATGETLTQEATENIVNLYRLAHSRITDLWYRFDSVIFPEIANGCQNFVPVDVNGWCITAGEGFGVGGSLGVVYHNLSFSHANGWSYELGKRRVSIYGGKGVENLCQHLARQIVMWQAMKINTEFPVALTVHDEVVCVVKEKDVEEAKERIAYWMSQAPDWCKGAIPLKCDVDVGDNYGDAKP